ncbi:nicotinamide/nicotinic acid mononucleotide adenylyltransferase 1-like [Paramormyrops kingsleyae]|uniref:nicotinamide/nicotinic acid mononucleotide adenylyltransferase 1-like n=1 Tax=Paramormyrops kingsleyae TaxID=1676925 RepID=UPI003B976A98
MAGDILQKDDKPIACFRDLKPGDVVLARWSDNKFYSATVDYIGTADKTVDAKKGTRKDIKTKDAAAERFYNLPSLPQVPKKTNVVLLSCGSYNPVTNMHLRMFELAREHLQIKGHYEVVKGIISPVGDGYNEKGLIEASHRVEMAKLAVENHSWIEVDSWESRQAEWLETVKVLRHHRQELLSQELDWHNEGLHTLRYHKLVEFSFSYPLPSELSMCMSVDASCLRDGPRLMLLCGADMLNSFVVPGLWKLEHIEEIIKNFGLVCITDDGSDLEAIIQGSDDLRPHFHNIHMVCESTVKESSADIPRMLQCGQTVQNLLPQPVLSYIRQRRLYTAENEQRNADVMSAPLQKHAGKYD